MIIRSNQAVNRKRALKEKHGCGNGNPSNNTLVTCLWHGISKYISTMFRCSVFEIWKLCRHSFIQDLLGQGMIRLRESHGLRIVDKNPATVRFHYCEENLGCPQE
ncbi:hypothetical protein NC651_008431 [Populus alba x Populus x berolinensis]|nr:hypothetical protein NC651_008431 [Populus alba x Populus x berolinensis]